MFHITSVDESGEIIQRSSSQHESVILGGRHPNGRDFIELEPPNGAAWWDYSTEAWVIRPESPGDTYQWDAVAKAWIDPRTLDELKAEAWERIKAARAAAEASPLTVAGRTYDADAASAQRIAGAVQMASLALAAGQGAEFEIAWTLSDNSSTVLSAAQMVDVGLSLGRQISAAHAQSRVLRARIDAATSTDELNNITWSPA